LSRVFFTSMAVTAAIGLAACGDSLAPSSQPPAASFAASLVPAHSAGENPLVSEVRVPVDGGINVADLAYDASRDAIWFVGADGAGASAFRLDTNSAAIERWPLPAGSFVGVYVQVKTDAAGVLWIADGYQVVRFRPCEPEVIRSRLRRTGSGSAAGSPAWVFARHLGVIHLPDR